MISNVQGNGGFSYPEKSVILRISRRCNASNSISRGLGNSQCMLLASVVLYYRSVSGPARMSGELACNYNRATTPLHLKPVVNMSIVILPIGMEDQRSLGPLRARQVGVRDQLTQEG